MKTGKAFLVVIAACVLATAAGCGKEENLLVAGDFERQTELQKSPNGWFATVVPRFKEFVSFEWDDQVAHSGEHSVSIAIDPAHPDDPVSYNWTAAIPACKGGGTYEISGWIKTEEMTTTAVIMLQFWNEDKSAMLGFATTQADYPVTGTSDWTQVGKVFTVAEGTAEVRVRAVVQAPDNRGGKAWFDDLCVVEVK